MTRLLSTSTTIRLHSTGVPLHFTHFSFTHPLTIMIVMINDLWLSFVIILQISPHLYKCWPLPPLLPSTPPSSALDHESQLGVRSHSQLHYTQLFMQQPAPPLPLARAELNQFKVCSVIAEEMGRWRLTRKAATMVFLLSTILREEVSVYKKRQLVACGQAFWDDLKEPCSSDSSMPWAAAAAGCFQLSLHLSTNWTL